jgi:O-antigen ligase
MASNFILKKNYLKTFLIFAISTMVIIAFFVVSPQANSRFKEMVASLKSNGGESGSTSIRKAVWKSSVHIISNNLLLGVGTGDLKDNLKNEYVKLGQNQYVELQLNPHNQYLQTFGSLGIIGFGLLIFLLARVMYISIKSGNTDGFLITLVIAIGFLFESMLETQAGVVFIAFFMSLYYKVASEKEIKISLKSN